MARPPQLPPETLTPSQNEAIRSSIRDSLNRARGRQSVQEYYERAAPRDRKLIRYLARLERFNAQQNVASGRVPMPEPLRPGPRRTTIGLPFATIVPHNVFNDIKDVFAVTGSNTPQARFFKAGLSDAKTISTAPFVGTYEVGAGLAQTATGGGTGRLERLAKGVVEGVKESAPAKIVTGDFEGAAQAFVDHPLLTGLDVGGVTAVAGRGLGALGRASGRSSTVRPPLAMTSDGQGLVERRYSKDETRRQVQKAADARREPVRDAQGKVVTVRQRGRVVPVLKATERERDRESRRTGDFTAARANAVERLVREEAGREFDVRLESTRGRRAAGKARDALPLPRASRDRARDLVAMVVEGTVRSTKTFERDLRAHRDRLKAELARRGDDGYRHEGERELAVARLEAVERALADPKLMARKDAIVAEGERIGRTLNEREGLLLEKGVLSDADRAKRARLIPAMIEHLGGRHVTEKEHARLEADARKLENEAKAALAAAPEDGKAAARAAYEQAREHRIAVSGRDPRGVKAHEAAVEAAQAARAAHTKAKQRVARLRAQKARVKGDPKRVAKVQAALDQAVAAERKAAKVARDAAETARRASLPKRRAAVRAAGGRHLSNEDVERALRDAGRDPATVAYLPHRADVRGGRAHHAQFRPGGRSVMDKPGTRTGEAYRKGATEASADLIRDAGVRQATQLAKAEQLDKLVADNGMRHPAWAKHERGEKLNAHEQRVVAKGGYFTAKEADELAQRIESDTAGRPVLVMQDGERMVPMRAFAARLSAATKQVIANDLQGPGAMDSLAQRLLNDRVLTTGELGRDTARNVVLVPAELVKRLDDHLRPAGELERLLQMVNRPFRAAVLTQPRWLTGNFVEPFFVRLPSVGSGVVNLPGLGVDILAARRVVKSLERSPDRKLRAVAEEIRAQQFGGLLIGNRGASNRRPFLESRTYGRLVARLPATRHLGEFGSKLARVLMAPANGYFVFNRVAIEQWAQKAAFGREARKDIQEFTGSWLQTVRLSQRAVQDAAEGLVGTPAQRRFMREQEKLIGKYAGYSPRMRAVVQGPMPFVPWMLNAVRFCYWTMPMERTALTALLVKTEQAVAEEWKQAHEDTPPWALGLDKAIRTADGGYVDVARYTPWSLSIAVDEGDFADVTNQVLPQASGVIAAASGRDPFGNPLKVEPTEANPTGEATSGDKASIALNSLLEAMVPYVGQIRRLREGGGTGYGNSNILDPKVKPGTDFMSAAERVYSPIRPIYLNPPTGRTVQEPTGTPAPLSREEQMLERLAQPELEITPQQEEMLRRLGG